MGFRDAGEVPAVGKLRKGCSHPCQGMGLAGTAPAAPRAPRLDRSTAGILRVPAAAPAPCAAHRGDAGGRGLPLRSPAGGSASCQRCSHSPLPVPRLSPGRPREMGTPSPWAPGWVTSSAALHPQASTPEAPVCTSCPSRWEPPSWVPPSHQAGQHHVRYHRATGSPPLHWAPLGSGTTKPLGQGPPGWVPLGSGTSQPLGQGPPGWVPPSHCGMNHHIRYHWVGYHQTTGSGTTRLGTTWVRYHQATGSGTTQLLGHVPPGWVPPATVAHITTSGTTGLGTTKALGHGAPNRWVMDHQVGCHQATATCTTTSGTTGLGTTKPLGQGLPSHWVGDHQVEYHLGQVPPSH